MVSGGQDRKSWLVPQLVTCVTLLGSILPSPTPPGYSPYEVVIPRQFAAQPGKAKRNELSYVIKAGGKDYVIRLTPQKNFLVKNFPVFTYDAKGERIESQPYAASECYYEGYAEGVVDSLVSLRTCSGLWGFLKIKGRSYGIEPLQESSTFQHLLYLTEEPGLRSSAWGPGDEKAMLRREKWETRQGSFTKHQKYVEMFIVVDHGMFCFEAGNDTRVTSIVLDTINTVNTYFHILNTHVILMGLEIWNKGNRINASDEILSVLQSFNSWRVAYLVTMTKHDTVHLFIHQNFGNALGRSYGAAICDPSLSAGVVAYTEKKLIPFTKAVSHELGHHMGLDEDGPGCFCGRYKSCIMQSHHAVFSQFSNCSVQSFRQLSQSGKLTCLNNVPKNALIYGRCGNGVVDAGEQCDCGGSQKCKLERCCNANCTLTPRAVCASGLCCRKCQFLPSGHLCRMTANECDLPEYCKGQSEWCPRDVYVQDGTPCDLHEAYCFRKQCRTHNALCSRIFGNEGTQAAPPSCFQALNTLGNAHANCGSDSTGTNFVKCKLKDVMCGRVHCVSNKSIGSALTDTRVVETRVGNATCLSAVYHKATDHYDFGAVPDGVRCGSSKVCVNQTCVSVAVLKTSCDPRRKCHSRGICNNLHNCHCNHGWAPPFCNSWGAGGSIDGGYASLSWSTAIVKHTLGTVIPLALVAMAFITVIVPRLGKLLSLPGKLCWGRPRTGKNARSRSDGCSKNRARGGQQ
ncbi:disintegrin and metalloproteinase domain-containing protein 21-like [Elgaria multicarinata webbii]|uniref:disintegrin and metalloproteinase domain-containing protein 21-like n=1 Tax=Elgaria multicarinata webbii TaxID=159646 RepID=UPI002FCD19BD